MRRGKAGNDFVVRTVSDAVCREWGLDGRRGGLSGRLCIRGMGVWNVFHARLRERLLL